MRGRKEKRREAKRREEKKEGERARAREIEGTVEWVAKLVMRKE